MTDTTRDPRYDAARTAFDELKLEDKAAFVVESTVNTFADLFQQVAHQLGDLFQDVADRVQTDPEAAPAAAPAPAAEGPASETASRKRAPRPPKDEGETGTI